MTLTVWTSGWDLPSTGVGVIQRYLDAALTSTPGWALVRGPSRPPGHSPVTRLRYKLRQLTARTRGTDVALVATTPKPVHLSAPYVTIVYDLRWLRTAGTLKTWYRRLELHRTTQRASRILVISERTRHDLLCLAPSLADRTELLPIGPGQCDTARFTTGEPGSVLLVGSAAHKRNLLMIEALGLARPEWCERLVCVNLPAVEISFARSLFGAEVEVLEDLSSEEMVSQFEQANVYACLSTEEGFGLPYIEALSAGAHVVAVDQPLTRELLGDAAVLLRDGDATTIADQLETLQWPSTEVRRRRAARYSWAETARVTMRALRAAIT